MSHVLSFHKPSLQTLLRFSGRVSVYHTHFSTCSRAKKSFWGRFSVGCFLWKDQFKALESTRVISEDSDFLLWSFFSLWPVQYSSQWPGVETRDYLKNSLLFDVETIESNRLNLDSSIWWFYKLEHYLILDSFWSRLWEKVYLGGNSWLLRFSELIWEWESEPGKEIKPLQDILMNNLLL